MLIKQDSDRDCQLHRPRIYRTITPISDRLPTVTRCSCLSPVSPVICRCSSLWVGNSKSRSSHSQWRLLRAHCRVWASRRSTMQSITCLPMTQPLHTEAVGRAVALKSPQKGKLLSRLAPLPDFKQPSCQLRLSSLISRGERSLWTSSGRPWIAHMVVIMALVSEPWIATVTCTSQGQVLALQASTRPPIASSLLNKVMPTTRGRVRKWATLTALRISSTTATKIETFTEVIPKDRVVALPTCRWECFLTIRWLEPVTPLSSRTRLQVGRAKPPG